MSISPGVFTPHVNCPENLRSFNEDGSRIDPDDEKYPRPQSELGSQAVLNAALKAEEEKRKSVGGEGKGERKSSIDSRLSGATLNNGQEKGKKHGPFRKFIGKSSVS